MAVFSVWGKEDISLQVKLFSKIFAEFGIESKRPLAFGWQNAEETKKKVLNAGFQHVYTWYSFTPFSFDPVTYVNGQIQTPSSIATMESIANKETVDKIYHRAIEVAKTILDNNENIGLDYLYIAAIKHS